MALQSALNFNYSISNSRSAQVLGKPHPPNFRLINHELLNIDTADLMKEEAHCSYEKSQSSYYPRYNETSNSSYTKDGGLRLNAAQNQYRAVEKHAPLLIPQKIDSYERSTVAPYRPVSANLIPHTFAKPATYYPIRVPDIESGSSRVQEE